MLIRSKYNKKEQGQTAHAAADEAEVEEVIKPKRVNKPKVPKQEPAYDMPTPVAVAPQYNEPVYEPVYQRPSLNFF